MSLVRTPQATPPNAPKRPSFFMSVKPLIDWCGRFVPWMGIGPAAVATVTYCDGHFKPFGFIRVGERGGRGDRTGLPPLPRPISNLATNRRGRMQADGRKRGRGSQPTPLRQGRRQLHVTVHSGHIDKTVILILAAKPR